jgi:hypothetical protein
MAPTLPGSIAAMDGTRYFYSGYTPRLECFHSPYAIVMDYNTGVPAGCGICHLRSVLETEIPKRLHEYELLAENGNPETDPRFWAHIEAAMGLVPPAPGEDLRKFRASRAMQYKQPSRRDLPVTSALWKMMGYQPKLAKPLVRSILGQSIESIAADLVISLFGVHESLGKGVRMALRTMRN